MRYDRSPILRERVACGGTNSSEFFAFDTSQIVVGVPIGDDDACAATLLEMLQTRLKQPLENVGRMHDTSNVRHAVQLAANLCSA